MLVNDATLLVPRSPGPTDEAQAEALALLALVAGQDVEPRRADDDGRWKIAKKWPGPDERLSFRRPAIP